MRKTGHISIDYEANGPLEIHTRFAVREFEELLREMVNTMRSNNSLPIVAKIDIELIGTN